MRKFFIAALILFTCPVFAQNAISWYKLYNGTAGKTSFILQLYRAGNDYDGWIYYKNTEQPYAIYGHDQKTTTIELNGYPDGYDNGEVWKLKFSGTNITGTFTSNKKTIAISCAEQKPAIPAGYSFTKGSIHLNKDKYSPIATYFASGLYFGNASYLNLIAYPSNNKNKTTASFLLDDQRFFFAQFREDEKELTAADYGKDVFSYNHDYDEREMISYSSAGLLVLSNYIYTYTGGAHGNYGTSHTVIDLQGKKALELTDVITDTAQLGALLEKNYRRQYKISDTEDLSESLFNAHIYPNDNFLLTGKCIGFTYTPYEIASYAQGEITIYIPLEECKGILTDKARTLLHL